jgi:hypothetical protein
MGRYSIRAAALAAAVLVAVCVPGARAASTSITGLTAAAAVTNTAPSLRWNAFTGATAYRIVRDGTLVGRVTATRFTDTALSASGVHSYSVSGVRADGSLTGAAGLQVTYDRLAPASITAAPGGSRLTGSEPTITWPSVSDAGPAGISQYNIRRDGVYLASVPAGQLAFTDRTAGAGAHGYTVRAEDLAGNLAAAFSPSAVITVDLTAPSAPAGLTASVSGTSVALAWQPASDPSGVTAYRVLRDGQQVTAVAGTSAVDSPGTGSHSYTVIAVDAAGNASAPTSPVSATVSGSTSRPPYTGVSLETGNDQSAGMKTKWPDAKIISLTLHWNQLEPSRGAFDWGNLDASLKDAAARHYKVILRILCGFNAPSWIYSDAQNRVTPAYIIPTDDGYRLTAGVNVPVPWDPDLLVLYKQMMSAVAGHLQGSDGAGGTLGDHVFMIPVAMATAFGSEMVENFGQGTWSGTYNGVFNSAWNRASVNQAAWLKLAPSGSTTAEKMASMQKADTQAWISSIDAQESILGPTGIMSSVAYGFAFTSFNTATAVESAEVPKYRQSLLTMFTNLQPKVNAGGSLGPWGSWCPPCDGLMKSAIADGGPVGFQHAAGMMNTPAKIEYANNNAIQTYHPRFIETVSTVVNQDYSYFFTSRNNVQSQLASIWGG